MSLFTTIKVEFESHLRRLAFDSDSSSWTAIRSQILTSYGVSVADGQNYVLHYLDDEGDLISVNSDTEFAEAMRCAKQKNKILKLTLSKSGKSISTNTESHKQAAQQDEKTQMLNVTVSSPSEEADLDVENVNDVDVDDAADQQVEEMDLPLSRRDLLSKSPTLSEASDSSFVSINAQSLRDDLDAKDELAVEGVNDSELLNTHAQAQAQAASLEDDAKAAVGPSRGASNPATPSQPEFISTDRAVVQDVLKQLAADPIQLKSSATPKATTPTTINNAPSDEKEKEEQVPTLQIPAQTESGKDVAKVQVHDVVVAAPLPCASSPCASSVPLMKVKELRSVIEGLVQEKMPEWVESVLSALDALDHADEDVKRVQQLTARIRDGLNESCDKSLSLQRMSDDVSKKIMRIMKQAHGNPGKDKEQIKKHKDKPLENDEEQKGKASPPTSAAATSSASASSSCCSSVSAASQSACGVVHSGITCDGCGMSPIRGVRFHCISCDQIASVREAGGYDLCETCEANAIHQKVNGKAHVMIKIKIPTKVIVDIEAPTGSLVGPHVYDVLRVNADGTRTPFRAAQPVIALPTPQATMAATVATAAGSSSKDEKKR